MEHWSGPLESLEMNPEFWHGKRVLLSGHTGFKGSWMSLWLQSLGAELSGFGLEPPTQPNLFQQARVGAGMRSITGDIRDQSALERAMQECRPEIVFHMAAQPLVRYSYENPIETYVTNVIGTVHLFEAVRRTPGVKAVVNVTSDKCYENRGWDWSYREIDPLGGHDPYSSSKACAELVTATYRRSYFAPHAYSEHGVAIATARAGNVIGGGDWAVDRLVPDILAALQAGRPVIVRNPGAIRPWQHVLEPLRGYLMLAEHLFERGPDMGGAWNFGPNPEDARPVSWIADQLVNLIQNGASWQKSKIVGPHESAYLKLDISKSYNRLQWRPILMLTDALKMVVDWVDQFQQGVDIQAVTLSQILTYQAKTRT